MLGYTQLSQIHSDWIKYWYIGTPIGGVKEETLRPKKIKGDRSLMAHRNSYKTTSLIVGAAWYLTFINPNGRIRFDRKSDKDASKAVSSLMNHFDGDFIGSWHHRLYKVPKLKTDIWGQSRIKIASRTKPFNEASVESAGIASGQTGSHYDIINSDDFITIKDRVSKAERAKTEVYLSEIINIPAPGGHINFTGTPWHKKDGWSLVPPPVKFPLGSCKIIGLDDERIASIRKRMPISLFIANYDLENSENIDGEFSEIKFLETPWEIEANNIGYLDPAGEGVDTCGLSFVGWNSKGQIQTAVFTWDEPVWDIMDKVFELMHKYNIRILYIETNFDNGALYRQYANTGRVAPDRRSHNKPTFIMTMLKQYYPEIYFDENSDDEAVAQITEWSPLVDLDDVPDSLAGALEKLPENDSDDSILGRVY